MTSQELANAILLRESGELSPEKSAELDAFLQDHPEARQMAEEFAVLQDAGRHANQQAVPPVSEVAMESLRKSAESAPSYNPSPWLVLAAGLVMILCFIPFLIPPSSPPSLVDSLENEGSFDLTELSGLSAELAELEEDIAAWSDTSTSELLQVADEAYWAEQLITPRDST